MTDEKPDKDTSPGYGLNWTNEQSMPDPSKTAPDIIVDGRGIKIEKNGVIFLEMSFGDIAEIISRLDSAEAEIGNLTDIINGMKEVQEE